MILYQSIKSFFILFFFFNKSVKSLAVYLTNFLGGVVVGGCFQQFAIKSIVAPTYTVQFHLYEVPSRINSESQKVPR